MAAANTCRGSQAMPRECPDLAQGGDAARERRDSGAQAERGEYASFKGLKSAASCSGSE